MSPISKTKRLSARRSVEVETFAGEDVHVVLREHARDIREQAGPIERLDLDLHEEDALRARRPLDLDHPLGLVHQRLHVVAVRLVHRDAGAAGDEADDLVAGHRRAASGELHQDVGCATHQHAGVRASAAAAATEPGSADRVRRPRRRRAPARRPSRAPTASRRDPRRPPRTATRRRRSAAAPQPRRTNPGSSASAAAGSACASHARSRRGPARWPRRGAPW